MGTSVVPELPFAAKSGSRSSFFSAGGARPELKTGRKPPSFATSDDEEPKPTIADGLAPEPNPNETVAGAVPEPNPYPKAAVAAGLWVPNPNDEVRVPGSEVPKAKVGLISPEKASEVGAPTPKEIGEEDSEELNAKAPCCTAPEVTGMLKPVGFTELAL